MAGIPRPPVQRAPQILSGLLLIIVAFIALFDLVIAWSTLSGALLVLIPHSYFAAYAFRFSGAKYAQETRQAFYQGQVGKYILTLVGFAVLFKVLKDIHLPALFVSYVVTLIANLLLTARLLKQ